MVAVVGCATVGEVVAGAAATTGVLGSLLRRDVPRALYRSAPRYGDAGEGCSRQSQYVSSRWSAPNLLFGCGFAFGSVGSFFWLPWFAS